MPQHPWPAPELAPLVARQLVQAAERAAVALQPQPAAERAALGTRSTAAAGGLAALGGGR
jgi:hypothetical protein